MTRVVAEARGLAHFVEPGDIERLFATKRPGDRVVALALWQAQADPTALPHIVEAIGSSLSAFEQYHALRAAEVVAPELTTDQRAQLRRTIEDQRSGGERKYILRNSDRWALSDRVLGALSRET